MGKVSCVHRATSCCVDGAHRSTDSTHPLLDYSTGWGYDIRIPNFLIDAYCRKGLLQKAETLINRAKLKGGKPNAWTWFYIVTVYLRDNKTEKAADSFEEALVVRGHQWKPNEKRDKEIISVNVQDRLLNNVRVGKSNLDAIS
ncbi:hypothetical protein Pint_36283 [Pistacia integerrima]|uniref:Uncharacterized protein n=1 Tax=Pistacia integerrima TaxID=434235 RepID=A0ACC0Y6M2_9ROSI|nr:hypothetical protein Pint_36283 [Pistacia integerrima]